MECIPCRLILNPPASVTQEAQKTCRGRHGPEIRSVGIGVSDFGNRSRFTGDLRQRQEYIVELRFLAEWISVWSLRLATLKGPVGFLATFSTSPGITSG